MPPIRVAFCTDGIYPLSVGGMQKHSRLLIEELLTFSEIDLTVIHPHTDKLFEDRVREISIEGIDETKNYLLECYGYSKRVYKQLIELKPDLVYSQGLSVWYGAGKFKQWLIINPHGLEPYQASGIKLQLITLPIRLVFNHLFKQAAVLISLGGKLTKNIRIKN